MIARCSDWLEIRIYLRLILLYRFGKGDRAFVEVVYVCYVLASFCTT
jgi:hypothetical protein